MAAAGVTFYDELGVPPDADAPTIEKAYKKKALELHPDKHPEGEKDEWEAKFKHLQEIKETLGNEQSRTVYDEMHLKKERICKVLILMDMNGSLLCKVDKKKSPRRLPPCDWEDRNNIFFLRPNVKEFLEAVLEKNSNIAFAIYTSRQMQNAEPQVANLFECAGCPRLRKQLFEIYAGDAFSVPDPDAGPYKSKRCLRKIWGDRKTCAKLGIKFDHCNTVNLDNEASKLADHKANGLLVPTFDATSLGRDDDVLFHLKVYLLRLAKECHGDVREYMKLFPFSSDGAFRARALPPVSAFEVEDDEVASMVEGIKRLQLSGKEAPESLRPQQLRPK